MIRDPQQRLPIGRRQRGLALMDVLLAMLLVGVGVVALAKLQAVVMKEGGSAQARAVAAQLAREKLDDLRNYSQLASGAAGVFGYDEIGTNTGGAEQSDGSLRIASGAVTVSDVSYSRTWSGAGYYYCALGAAPQATNCSGATAKIRPDFKKLRVTVAWTESSGTAQSLVVEDTVSATDPVLGATALINGATSSGPIVQYRPGSAPQVIAIDVGGGQKKETTNPTPTLTRKTQNSPIVNTIARYETIRYSTENNTITRQEFITLNCVCQQAGSGSAYNLQRQKVTKRIGTPVVDNQRPQAAECAVCCRDHHDDASCIETSSAGRKGCYDPFRPQDDYHSTGDHNHYNANGQLANDNGTEYQEACRLERIDGLLEVAQDWNLVTLSEIPEEYFTDSDNIARYGDYVKDYVAAYLAGATPPEKVWEPDLVVSRSANKQALGRGLYVDYLSDEEKQAYANRIAEGEATVFQELPFYEVNLTKLAQWTTSQGSSCIEPGAGSNCIASVTNDQIKTEAATENLYSRGKITGRNFGITDVLVSARKGNTGVINEFISTDPDDSTHRSEDFLEVTVPGANPTISGTVSPAVSGLSFTASSTQVSCALSGTAGDYSCSVPYGFEGSITPQASGYRFEPAARSYDGVTANTSGQDYRSAASTATYTIAGSVSPAVASLSFTTSADVSCTYASGGYRCAVPSGASGSIGFAAPGYTLSPSSYSYTSVSGDLQGPALTATAVTTTYTIVGAITPAPASVSFAASGASCDSYSSTDGSYVCTVPSGWSGSITPSAANRTLTPASRSYGNVTANVTGQNYSAAVTTFTITGVVTPAVAGVSFATNNGGGSCSYASGSYSCSVPGGWSGAVTPSASGYSFSPMSRNYTNVTSDQSSENYDATASTPTIYTISGTITGFTTGGSAPGSVSGSQGASCSTTRNPASGNYINTTYVCTVPADWANGVITVTPDGNGQIDITPNTEGVNKKGTYKYSVVNSNQTLNFSCSGKGC